MKHQLSSSGESEDETPKIVVKLSNTIKKKTISDSLRKMEKAEKSDDAIESSEDESRTVSKNIKVSPPSVEMKLKKAKAQKGKSPKSSSSNFFTSLFSFMLNLCNYYKFEFLRSRKVQYRTFSYKNK